MICTQTSCVMICHYFVMDKKMTAILCQNYSHFLVERGGFEPPKSLTTDLQSAPFGHSGTSPYGAGDRNRTNNLLITNQLLCLLSYTSVFSCWCLGADSNHRHRDFQSLALPPELPRHIVDPTYSTVTRRIEFWFGGL